MAHDLLGLPIQKMLSGHSSREEVSQWEKVIDAPGGVRFTEARLENGVRKRRNAPRNETPGSHALVSSSSGIARVGGRAVHV